MIPYKLKLVKVHENTHLTKQCIDLLNEEWPRDKSNRLKTLSKSCDNFPMCLALVNDQDIVFGFVKLTSELPFNKCVFIESLVVNKDYRGKGFGRFIISEVERIVKLSGIDRITLTTMDKEDFYLKTGFVHTYSINVNKLTSIAAVKDNQIGFPLPPPMPEKKNLFNSSKSPTDKILMYKDI